MVWYAEFVDVVAKLELQAFIRDSQEIGDDRPLLYNEINENGSSKCLVSSDFVTSCDIR